LLRAVIAPASGQDPP